jgi:hypothetical protein
MRIGFAALALVSLWGTWRFTAERWSLLLDRVYTSRMLVIRSTPFGWNGTYLQFEDAIPGLVGLEGFNPGEHLLGAHLLGLSGPGPEYKQVATLEVNATGQLELLAAGRRFVLGLRAGTVPGDDGPISAFAAEPGDTTSFVLESSLLGWPAPITLAGTYLSGAPTTWLRHLYYRLSWRKAWGAQLAMVWRCEQGWERINGWHNFGVEELIRAEITPAQR